MSDLALLATFKVPLSKLSASHAPQVNIARSLACQWESHAHQATTVQGPVEALELIQQVKLICVN